MSLRDSLELMESMRDLYSSQEDADKIRELRRMRGEIHAAFRQREAYMAELIREMTHRVTSAEDKLAVPETAQERAARLAELEASKEAAAAELERLTSEAEELGGEKATTEAQKAALAAQRAEADAAARATEAELRRALLKLRVPLALSPLARRHLQLYRLLTSLTWDVAAPARAKGHVVDALAGDVRPFDLDPTALGRVELADALWAHIGTSAGATWQIVSSEAARC